MFLHNFKYSLKSLLRNKMLIFWTAAFPLIMATFFQLAFSNIEKNEKLSTISIGIVQNEEYDQDQILKEAMKDFGNKQSENHLFDITLKDKEQLDDLLDNNKIEGYIYVEKDIHIIVKKNGIGATILKHTIDNVKGYEKLSTDIVNKKIEEQIKQGNQNIDYSLIQKQVIEELNKENIYLKDKTSNNLNYTMIEFYSLIAFTCFLGATLSSQVISNYQANINKKGARITLSKAKKTSLVLGGFLASLLVQIAILIILFGYTILILKVDYGNQTANILLLTLLGACAGLALGVLVGSCTIKTENARIGVLLAITMAGSFLSGMMGITMKYVIDSNLPFLNQINPIAMITDGFYSLYYYETLNRFFYNLISLGLFTIIVTIISVLLLRRKKHDSI